MKVLVVFRLDRLVIKGLLFFSVSYYPFLSCFPIGKGYELIPTKSGKHLVLLNGYTYAERKKRFYYCSKRASLGCKAQVKFDNFGQMIYAFEEHVHGPPEIIKSQGAYVKLLNFAKRFWILVFTSLYQNNPSLLFVVAFEFFCCTNVLWLGNLSGIIFIISRY